MHLEQIWYVRRLLVDILLGSLNVQPSSKYSIVKDFASNLS